MSKTQEQDSRKPAQLGAAHLDASEFDREQTTYLELIERRLEHLGGSMLFYHDPVHLVRGEGIWLFDDRGNRYLDCYNNVASVGHCHPAVVKAIAEQAAQLNTHTRYLHENVIRYAERLASLMPDGLEVCLFTCTGTEANELAMRIARTVTGNYGAVVLENSYHGNSNLMVEMSTLAYPSDLRADYIAVVEPPNTYRGSFRRGGNDDASLGRRYADLADAAIQALHRSGHGVAAFMCDAIFDSQGGLEAPADYFQHLYQKIRAAGGLCIADEVQPGFGRTGTMWGFEQYDVVPDIVTLGKPMGGGHPVGGVVTTKAIYEKFAKNAWYFNTYGGNPVSAAAGLAVLDAIEDQGLVEHTAETGQYLRERLEALQDQHTVIGNVRGRGLYQAVELVKDREARQPDPDLTSLIPDAMKEEGILIGLSGRYGNVLKIRPPQVFTKANADEVVDVLDRVLNRLVSKA